MCLIYTIRLLDYNSYLEEFKQLFWWCFSILQQITISALMITKYKNYNKKMTKIQFYKIMGCVRRQSVQMKQSIQFWGVQMWQKCCNFTHDMSYRQKMRWAFDVFTNKKKMIKRRLFADKIQFCDDNFFLGFFSFFNSIRWIGKVGHR